MYENAPFAIPAEIVTAHERRLRALGRPGTWLTADRRLEIAQEARAAAECELCQARRDVVSPSMVDGDHDRVTAAPDAALDASHRIVTDPHRLSETWVKGVVGDGLDAVEYVELVGVVVTVVALDTFARAIGTDPLPFPLAEPGEPSRVFPDGLSTATAWVPTVLPGDATGELAEFYSRFEIGNIVVALSMVPAEFFGFWELVDSMYLPKEAFPDPTYARALSRVQMEVLASQVSMLNQCFYCSSVHTFLLEMVGAQAGVDVTPSALVTEAPDVIGVPHGDLLIAFARAVHGGSLDRIAATRRQLRAAAGPDAAADAAGIVALFMAINRVANATGTRLEDRFETASRELRSALAINSYPVNGVD